jgi:glycosyltransferase involved in cell wall biosynthesis
LKESNGWPYVVTTHGYDIYDLPFRNEQYRGKITNVLNEASAIVSVSNEIQKLMIEQLHTSNEIVVIPNGYDPLSFHEMSRQKCREQLKLPQDKKIILTVGYLAPEKGQRILIESSRKVLESRKDVLFVLVGDGTDRKLLEDKIQEYKLKERFILAGKKKHSEIPVWMNAADILCIPSLSEGVPTVLFEALGCGIPVVATSVGGIPEIIQNDNHGVLLPPDDKVALTNALANALQKNWNRPEIIEYSKNFTWEGISNSILNLYKKILTVSRRGGNNEPKN